MPRGDKSKYTSKQKRQAQHVEEGYEERGASRKKVAARGWATVNKMSAGGKRPGGAGRGKPENKAPAKVGGSRGGRAAASRPQAARKASAQRGAQTRKARSAR